MMFFSHLDRNSFSHYHAILVEERKKEEKRSKKSEEKKGSEGRQFASFMTCWSGTSVMSIKVNGPVALESTR